MTEAANFRALVEDANRAIRSQARTLGGAGGTVPRFEVYHAGFSLCSQKLRTTLFEKGHAFVSHDVSLAPIGHAVPENYRPGYVRLRMLGAPGAKFADGYTGRSATTSEGFDPCVVPTLVDHQHERVVVDSTAICRYLDDAGAPDSVRLVPTDSEAKVMRHVAVVDGAPHPGVLYGPTPGKDRRPGMVRNGFPGIQDRKKRALERMMRTVPNDASLLAAYEAKISKEMGSKAFVADTGSMESAVAEMRETIAFLDGELAVHDGPWACGNAFTLADIMWTMHLYRLEWLGLGNLWRGRAAVSAYASRAFARPSFRAGVLDWPGANPPSEHVPETNRLATRLKSLRTIAAGIPWREALLGPRDA